MAGYSFIHESPLIKEVTLFENALLSSFKVPKYGVPLRCESPSDEAI